MRRENAISVLMNHQESLSNLGVKSLNLFGSVARDEARPDSDIDLLVAFNNPKGLFQLLKVQY